MTTTEETTEERPFVGTDEQLKEAVDVLTATLIKDRGPADAVALLQELVDTELDDEVVGNCPAMGCCGCGSWMTDVRTPAGPDAPRGEAYCWLCVDRPPAIKQFTVFPGRER